MARLRESLERAGYGDVRTLQQSGNVVLTSDADGETTERDLAAVLRDEFGFEIAVLIRRPEDLAEVIARDPFRGDVDDPSRYQVSFLSGDPDPDGVRGLKSAAAPPERVVVDGREIYAWHPAGVGRSELAKMISERTLGTGVTARNWRTLTKLLELAEQDART
jgi:uncharacterized protein (DUF1697 family)